MPLAISAPLVQAEEREMVNVAQSIVTPSAPTSRPSVVVPQVRLPAQGRTGDGDITTGASGGATAGSPEHGRNGEQEKGKKEE